MKSFVIGLLVIVLLIAVGASHAQSYQFVPSANNTVILTTGINSIDGFSAYPIASIHGLPILSINGTNVSAAFAENLSAQGVKNVIIIGGPAVISNSTEALLESYGLNVLRIAGITAPETAVDLAEYFSPSPVFKCAILAEYNETPSATYRYEFAASTYAAVHKCYLFPAYFGNVPADIIAYLQSGGVTNVTYFGSSPLNTTRLPINVTQHVLNATAVIGPRVSSRLLIVGVNGNAWNASLGLASNVAVNASFVLVTNATAQMPGIITYINSRPGLTVRVVGVPLIVSQIDASLGAAGIAFTSYGGIGELLAEKLLFHSKNLLESEQREFRNLSTVSAQSVQLLINETENLLQEYNATVYNLTLNNVSGAGAVYNRISRYLNFTQEAQQALNAGNASAALNDLFHVRSRIRSYLFESLRPAIREDINAVRNSIPDLIESLIKGARIVGTLNMSHLPSNLSAVIPACRVPTVVGLNISDVEDVGASIGLGNGVTAVGANGLLTSVNGSAVLRSRAQQISSLIIQLKGDLASGNISDINKLGVKIRKLEAEDNALLRFCPLRLSGSAVSVRS